MRQLALVISLLVFLVFGGSTLLAQEPPLACSQEDLTATIEAIAASLADAQAALANDPARAVMLLQGVGRTAERQQAACSGLAWSGEEDFNNIVEAELEKGVYILEYEFTGAEGHALGGIMTIGFSNLVGIRNPMGLLEMNDPGETSSGRTRINIYDSGPHLIELDISGTSAWKAWLYRP